MIPVGRTTRRGTAGLAGLLVFLILAVILDATAQTISTPGREDREGPPARDRDAPPETRFKLAPFLSFGAQIELESTFLRNADLDGGRGDDLALLEPQLDLAVSFDPSPRLQAFLAVEISREFFLEGGGYEKPGDTRLELEEAFLFLKELTEGLSVKVGRQKFKDRREWLYDEELDALRFLYRRGPVSLEMSASRRDIVNRDLLREEEGERINNYIVHGAYALGRKATLAAYTLVRDDRSSDRESPIFLGIQSYGEILDDLDYWLELAHVRGRDGARRLRGFGFDVGASYQLAVPWKPSITLGYAFGTGDADPDNRLDTSFRQTGLQENEGRFQGVTKFKYYGVLFDPELSNLAIWTAGIGVRPLRRTSLDLVYHRYLQHHASSELRDVEIEAEPTGRSRRLGQEIDLVVGYREIPNLDVELVLGYFMPGRAFPAGSDSAFFAKLEFQFRF